VLDLCSILAKAGVGVALITYKPQDIPDSWNSMRNSNSPKVVEIDRPGIMGRLSAKSCTIVKKLAECADFFHFHSLWDTASVELGAIARSRHAQVGVSLHGILDDWCMSQKFIKKFVYYNAFARRFAESADFVHCTAEGERRQASKWIRSSNLVVLPLPVNLGEYEKLPGSRLAKERFSYLDNGNTNLLFLSRLHKKKRPDVLIDVAKELKSHGILSNIIVAGPGDEAYVRELRAKAAKCGLEKDLYFPSMVTGTMKVSLYQAADFFVLPSSQENFGIVLVEAMAAGAVVITTREVDIWPELEKSGAIIVEADPVEIASAIRREIWDPVAQKERKRLSREGVFRWLDLSSVGRQYVELYSSRLPEE
jgi:glycosyltransferase involved in cell wall biosynthesis